LKENIFYNNKIRPIWRFFLKLTLYNIKTIRIIYLKNKYIYVFLLLKIYLQEP